MMRSLWVTNDLPPRPGGIQQFVDNLLRRVEPSGAVVVAPRDPGAPEHDAAAPYRVVRSPGGVWPTPGTLRRVRDVAAADPADVVVLGASWPLGELGRGLVRDPGVPVMALTHGLEAGLCGVGLGSLVARATRDLAAVTTISRFTTDRLRPHVRAARIEHVPPGVDLDTFHPHLDGAAMRAAWGVPADALLVGCVSRLVHRKGQDVLMDAWPALSRRHPDAWLALVGTGPLERTLRSGASRLDRVVVPGRVAWRDLPRAYAALDVFAMPCRTRLAGTDVEGLGIVYLEAQACGVPVVAGRSGGAPETVREGETGLVVDGTDRDAVRGAIDRLLTDADGRRRMGAAARRWTEASWGWDAVAGRFRRLLSEVVETGR